MSAESASLFEKDIQRRIDYFRKEYQLSYIEAVGVLDIAKQRLLHEIMVQEAADDED